MRIQIKAVTEGGTKNDQTVIKKSVETVDGIKYSAFKTGKKGALPGYDLIVTGAILDVDIYESGKYKNIDAARTVTDATPAEKQQVAKAVEEHKTERQFGKSPEIIALEHKNDLELEAVRRLSIEGQTAMQEVGQLIRLENVTIDTTLSNLYFQALHAKLGAYVAGLPHPAVASLNTPRTPAPTQETAKSEASEWPHLEKLGDLWARCNEKDITIATAQGYLGIKRGLDWTGTPDEAWTKIEAAIAIGE